MKIYENLGVRTYRRGFESARIALAIVRVAADLKRVGAWTEERGCWFADVVNRLREDDATLGAMLPPASYQAISRAVPFEYEGLLYRRVKVGDQGKMYEKTQALKFEPGRLVADTKPEKGPKSLKARVSEAVEAELAKAEPFANVFALREEARKYIDAKFAALESRVAKLEVAGLE
jgi:hypothetical protein